MKQRTQLRFVLEGIEGILVFVVIFLTWPISRLWLRNWGSSHSEQTYSWPGDELITENHKTYTRATTIAAPPEKIWPWLIQFGLGKAGFYSYELLERLVGIPVTNLESVEPSMQSLVVGDTVRLHPKTPGIPVGRLSEGKHVCFGGEHPALSNIANPDPSRSWSMYLDPQEDEKTRFVLRACIGPLRKPSWFKRIGLAIEAPIDFVMEQRMLRTVKRLAEPAA